MQWLSYLIDLCLPLRNTARCVKDADALVCSLRLRPVVTETQHGEIVSLLPYKDPLVHALILEAKFYRNERAWDMLGSLLAEYLLEQIADEHTFQHRNFYLVPVPLSSTRRKERGYNQTEEICRRASIALGTAVTLLPNALTRVRHTRPQTELSGKERLENVREAFQVTEPLNSRTAYILIDDVFTTGATMYEAHRALTEGGAKDLMSITLAR